MLVIFFVSLKRKKIYNKCCKTLTFVKSLVQAGGGWEEPRLFVIFFSVFLCV